MSGRAELVSRSTPPCIQVDAHGRQVQAAIPVLGGAVAAALQVPVDLELFVAPFRGCPCLVFFFPFPGISRGDTEEPGVVIRGDMDHFPVAGIAALIAVGAFMDVGPCVRAAVFDPHPFSLNAIPYHLFTVHADGPGVHGTEGDALFLKSLCPFEVEIDERGDAILPAEEVSGEVVVSRIQEEFADPVFRKKRFHGHEGMDKTNGVMHGCGIQEREDREVVPGSRVSKQIKVIAIVIAVPR